MGGGVAIRAATKVASFGVNGGLRGSPLVPTAEQSMATASQKVSRPATSLVSSVSTEEGRSSFLLSSQNGKVDASVQRPLWDDDWEFALYEEDLHVDSMTPMPRVVFGGVPTMEEATEATSELKEALEQVYFSSNSSVGSETKPCVTEETAVALPSVPNHALQAFVLLKESSAAQRAVASLASDKNVWDAVMQNEKVVEFFQSQRTTGILPDEMDLNDKESCGDNGFDGQESIKNTDNEDDGKSSGSSESGFMGFMKNVKLKVKNVKLKVTEMVMNMSDFIQSLFGGLVAGNESVDEKGSASGMPKDKTAAAGFMGLVILVIMVVLVKRG
ncbi:uncharacterized protein LOC122639519 [Telopea speciosissima]|uniref:uncharacterized protein LOC122639519 n=1 Tax=Telopea speciosissima TaxID=54955 RepID=UPI001CC7602A|nr:uncharacterized protein LOC122639519 [Telopea speciosissima]